MRQPVIALSALGLALSTVLLTVPAASAAPTRPRVKTACAFPAYFENVAICAAEPSEGTEPYTYLWTRTGSDGESTSRESFYSWEQVPCDSLWVRETVTVTDATGATARKHTKLDCAPPAPGATSEPLAVRAACSDTAVDPGGGFVICVAQPSGGTPPYSYEWTAADDGGVYESYAENTPEFFCAPGPARFVLTVTDAAGATEQSVHDLTCVNDGT
jgi:hypothetical protein